MAKIILFIFQLYFLCLIPLSMPTNGETFKESGGVSAADAKLFVGQSIHSIFLKPSKSTHNKALPICVIGAGISGLSLATLLQAKGHSILLFERRASVGGKIVTFRLGREVQVEMCPLFYTPDHTHLLSHIRRFGLTSAPFNESDRIFFDSSSTAQSPSFILLTPPPVQTTEEKVAFTAAITSYVQERSKYEKELDSYEFGFKNASPALFVSMGEWLELRNLTILRQIFIPLITTQGYGALEDVAAIYGLKLADKNLILSRLDTRGTYLTLREGLDILAQKMAHQLHPYVLRNSEVVKVSRIRDSSGPGEGGHQVVFSFDKILKRKVSTVCQKVVLAFPPLLNSVQKMVDLSEEERSILGHVRIHQYTSAAHHIPGLERAVYLKSRPKGEGEVVAFVRQSHGRKKNVYSSYSWIRGDFNATLSKEEDQNVRRQLAATLKDLSPAGSPHGGAITFYRETSEYFPHVNRAALEGGFYEKFESMQGKGGLYYATTLLGFETMNEAIKISEALVQKYF